MKLNNFLLLCLGFALILIVFLFYKGQEPKVQSIYGQNLTIQNKIPTQTGKNLFLTQSQNLTIKVDTELVDLDSQIISCDANVDSLFGSSPSIGGSCNGPGTMLNNTNGKFLGGQCCGTLTDTKDYHEQLKKLKKYSNIPDIPFNPYKTPVELAKKWIDYDKNTVLPKNKQTVYDEALKISKEGPCCCKCWHYFVNEGIAKKMINDFNWNSKQVADFWEVSDICGT